ncbi:Rv3235 family protein [Nocardioides campestrisoli]|uniref:Rv3235 family protein n=1 Tax=Nocardioides campestrisoli TaxID=2736757 RepID=UPI00163D91D6|nr:Rv3235 family protein [Nocardioides campestrisoli]
MSTRPAAPSGATVTRLHARAPLAAVQGTLALDLAPLLDPPVPGARPGLPGSDLVDVAPRQREALREWTNGYLQAVVEIVAGDRPASQLQHWTRRDVHQDLTRRAELVARAGGHVAGQGRRPGLARSQVVAVRLSFLSARTVEVAAHVRHGARSRAVAARFETFRGRWVCTALEFC